MKHIFLFLLVAIALVSKAQNVGIGTTIPGFPLTVKATNATTVISATNNDPGNSSAIYGSTSSGATGVTSAGASGVVGEVTATTGADGSAGVRGINRSTNYYGAGVTGYHAGNGIGVYGEALSGTGVIGYALSGNGGGFSSSTGIALSATSYSSLPVIQASNSNANNTGVIYASGNAALSGTATSGASAVVGELTATNGGNYSAAVRGINHSTNYYGAGVLGYHAGNGVGVDGESPTGTGIIGVSTSGSGGTFSSSTGSAVNGVTYGSVPVFQASNSNANNTGVIYASGNSTLSGNITSGASGVVGELTSTSGGSYSAGIRGINRSTTIFGIGVIGYQAGGGIGVYGETVSGFGVEGYSVSGTGGIFSSNSGTALQAVSSGTGPTLSASNSNTGGSTGTIYGSSASTVVSGAAASGGTAVFGEMTATSGGYFSAGLRGINRSTTGSGMGVVGYQAGAGIGVYGETPSGQGVSGYSASGQGGNFGANSGTALYANSAGGAGLIVSSGGAASTLSASNSSSGNAVSATSSGTSSVISATNTNAGNNSGIIYASSASTAGSSATGGANAIIGVLTPTSGAGFSAAVRGVNYSTTAAGMGVVGYQGGAGMGVYGEASSGSGINGYSTTGYGGNFTSNSGTGILANAQTSGNAAIFQGGSVNVARIDRTGKGFFNGGTQTGGADVAEAFAVEGNRNEYEPGDVLVISTLSDRTVAKSNSPYSTLVVGVYATKPGVLLTERMENETQNDLVPMGVVGVIPTKVCSENGSIHRGDMLVTSSVPGRAMKATPAQIQFGSVIGKALEDFTYCGNGLIRVLVNVK